MPAWCKHCRAHWRIVSMIIYISLFLVFGFWHIGRTHTQNTGYVYSMLLYSCSVHYICWHILSPLKGFIINPYNQWKDYQWLITESGNFQWLPYSPCFCVQMYPRDQECISTMITFEHLNLMCQGISVPSPTMLGCVHPHSVSIMPSLNCRWCL